jgi:hypothetical protein
LSPNFLKKKCIKGQKKICVSGEEGFFREVEAGGGIRVGAGDAGRREAIIAEAIGRCV